MLSIVLALAASASWGLGDFLGGLTSRRLHVLTVLVVQQVFGLAVALTWVLLAWDGFLEFMAAELAHPGIRAVVGRFLGDGEIRKALRDLPAAETHHSYAGGLLEHTVAVSTLVRETAQLHQRLRGDLLLSAALLHDVGRVRELGRGPSFRPTDEGRLLGHVHLGLRLVEERTDGLDPAVRAELLHAIAVHHEARGARTAEAAVLYHANQLDAAAATRPVE